jgi:hypothetical protein
LGHGGANSAALLAARATKMLALQCRVCVAQTKIAAGATSSPDESPLILRCGRASTSVTEKVVEPEPA